MVSPLQHFENLQNLSLGNQLTESSLVGVENWRGFVFEVAGLNLSVPFEGQFEIVPSQALFPVPMTRSWVRGMTNIRGEIYTVIDFSEFIGKRPVRNARNCHLLLLPDEDLKSALMIESRISLRSFDFALPSKKPEIFDSGVSRFLSRVVIDGDQEWGVIDIEILCQSAAFVQAGI